MMIKLPEKPTLDDLDNVLKDIAEYKYPDIENSQINAIKAMISLRLNRERLNKRQTAAIHTDDFEQV